jgi:modulator of FtsH protease HflC
MSPRTIIGIVIGLAVLVLLNTGLFVVPQSQQAIVLQLGSANRIVTQPGLGIKVPFLEDVMYFDKKILSLDVDPVRVTSTDKRLLEVDAYAQFRIEKPLRAFQTMRSQAASNNQTVEEALKTRLGSILQRRIGVEMSKLPLSQMLSPERGEVMRVIQTALDREAKQLGATVIDVKIKRADLPAEVLGSAFDQMITERRQAAISIRANGEQIAQVERARGDTESGKIYADAFGKDPAFYDFYRSLEAYRRTLRKEDTTMVLSPDSAFMASFKDAR